MAVNNPFKITYAGQAVGGTSDSYQLHGPYTIDKSFNTLRLIFDVVVVSSSYSTVQSNSDTLELAFRKRDQSLIIDISGNLWTYTFGTHIFNTQGSIAKTGDSETDRGYSRAYTVVIEGDLPSDDTDPGRATGSAIRGLREIEFNVDYTPSRQKIVSIRGVYTATESPSNLASVNYLAANGADAEASAFLTALDSSATFELVEENFAEDRNNHLCNFDRQYVELLVNQSTAGRDHASIRDHRIVFNEMVSHPGDSKADVRRLRRMAASYDCAADIDTQTDLQFIFSEQIKPHLISLLETNFTPIVFAIEDQRVAYDETSKRLSASIQFLFQPSNSDDIVEINQSLAFREQRTIDYTPVHADDEFAMYADVGFSILERVASRTVIVMGEETPKRRLGLTPKKSLAGKIEGLEGGAQVLREGWNILSNASQITDLYIGDPDEEQIRQTVLTETVVERFNRLPRKVAITSISRRAAK